MAMTAFELMAILSIDSSGFNEGLSKATTAIDSMTGPIDNLVAGGINKAVSALKEFGSEVVSSGMEFESKMSQVSAISGKVADKDLQGIIDIANKMGLQFENTGDATSTAMSILTAKAKEMGEKTKFSAAESADAFTYMSMAGWKTADMLEGIEGIMMLAAASGEDLATTSDIVTDALTAFGQGAEQSGRLADIMAAASSNANTNVSMMGETFKYAAPVAGALGYSMEDTALAIGLMANAGIKGSQAGTSLRSMMSRLSAPTGDVNQAMHTLGVSLTDGEGNMLSFRDVMGQLRKAMGSGYLTMDEYTDRLRIIEEELAAQNLTMSGYALRQQELNEKLENGTITQEQYAQGMADLDELVKMGLVSTTGSYEQALNDLAIAMWGAEGAQAAELASTIAGKNAMSGFLAIIGASDEDFDNLANAIDNSSGSAQAMADTMNDNLQGALTLLDSALGTLKLTVYETFSDTAKDAVSSLTGVVTAFTAKLQDWLSKDETQEKIGKITDAISRVMDIISDNLDPILDGLIGIIEGVANAIVFLIEHADLIVAGIKGILIAWGLLKAAKIAMSVANAVHFIAANPIVAILAAVAAAVAAIIVNWESIKTFFNEVWEGIKNVAETVSNAITGFFNGALAAIQTAWSTVTSFFTGIWDGITQAFAQVESWFQKQFMLAYQSVQKAWKDIGSWFGSMWSAVKTALKDVNAWFSEKFSAAWGSVSKAFSGFVGYFRSAWESVKQVFSVVGDVLSKYFGDAFLKIQDALSGWGRFFTGLRDKITKVFDGIGDWFRDIGKRIIQGIGEGIENARKWLHEKISGVVGAIKNWFKGLLGIKSPSKVMRDQVGLMIGYGIAEGIEESVGAVRRASSDVMDVMPNADYSMNVRRNFTDAYSGAMDSFAARMEDAMSSFQQTIVLKLNDRELGRAVRGYV